MIVLHRWVCTLCAEMLTRQSWWALRMAMDAHEAGHVEELLAEVAAL